MFWCERGTFIVTSDYPDGAYFIYDYPDKNNRILSCFKNIPVSLYWAVITLTTVGYGDFFPHTAAGRVTSVIAALTGSCLLAMPIAIIGSKFNDEFDNDEQKRRKKRKCVKILRSPHSEERKYAVDRVTEELSPLHRLRMVDFAPNVEIVNNFIPTVEMTNNFIQNKPAETVSETSSSDVPQRLALVLSLVQQGRLGPDTLPQIELYRLFMELFAFYCLSKTKPASFDESEYEADGAGEEVGSQTIKRLRLPSVNGNTMKAVQEDQERDNTS